MPRGKPPPDQTSICVGCGLCCDGTLHDHAEYGDEDESIAAAVGLEVIEKAGKRVFLLPCPNLSCGACSVYSKRPGICRGYRCKLLKDVDEGRISVIDAREKIVTARNFVAAVRRLSPKAITLTQRGELWGELEDGFAEMEQGERQRAAEIILALAALHQYLNRWFRKPKAKADLSKGDLMREAGA